MDDRQFDDVVRSIATGTPVDWDTLEESPSDLSIHEVLRELRVIARIAGVHAATGNPAATPGTGQVWGPLILIEAIGRGAFANVYRARDRRLERDVALKLLPASTEDARASSIIHEARLLARLTHPNVATVFGAEHLDGHIGIWMEFVPGTDLESLVTDRGPLDPSSVLDVGQQVCQALAAVHRAGVLHRDVKATNVRRTPDGRIVLLDFGSCGDLFAEAPLKGLVGTPLYLAPEILNGERATAQGDIYSVGVLLYHLLTGSYPVTGKTVGDLRKAHAERRGATPHVRVPGIPRRLGALIERATHPDPQQRFATADDMYSALRSVQVRPRRLAMAAVLVTLGTIASLGVWSLSERGFSSSQPNQGAAAWLKSHQLNHLINWAALGSPSPDGRLLPYSDGNTGNLAVLDLRTGATRLLTNAGEDEYAESSVFSPDSRRIAYTWHAQECHCPQVRLLNLATGGHQVLIREEGVDDVAALAWSHDGRSLLVRISNRLLSPRLEMVSIAGGHRQVLHAVLPLFAAFSPDDRFVVYDQAPPEQQQRDLHILDLASLVTRVLVSGPADERAPIWIDDRVLFASNRENRSALWSIRVANGHPSGAPKVLTDLVEPGFSPIGLTTGGALFYLALEGGTHVYTADIDRDAGSVSTPVRVTNADDREFSPEWSPDGQSLVWLSRSLLEVNPRGRLRVHDRATARTREISTSFSAGQNPRWSPDGATLLVRGVDSQAGLRLIDARTGALRATYLRGLNHGDVEWATDGTAAFYQDFDGNLIGRLELPSGASRVMYRLPKGQTLGRGIALTRDGATIVTNVFEGDGQSIIRIPAAGGEPTTLVALRQPDYLRLWEWMPDGRYLLFTRGRQIPEAVAAQELQLWSVGRNSSELHYLNLSMPNLGSIRPSPDGRRLAFISDNERNRVRVLENVLTALRHSP